MDLEQFKKFLTQRGVECKETDNGLEVFIDDDVFASSITSIPDNITFNNNGDVYLSSLTSLPVNTRFNNMGSVYIHRVSSLPDSVQFDNTGYIYLLSIFKELEYRGNTIKNNTVIESSKIVKQNYTLFKGKAFMGSGVEEPDEVYILVDNYDNENYTKASNLDGLVSHANRFFYGDFGVFNFFKAEDFQ